MLGDISSGSALRSKALLSLGKGEQQGERRRSRVRRRVGVMAGAEGGYRHRLAFLVRRLPVRVGV